MNEQEEEIAKRRSKKEEKDALHEKSRH